MNQLERGRTPACPEEYIAPGSGSALSEPAWIDDPIGIYDVSRFMRSQFPVRVLPNSDHLSGMSKRSEGFLKTSWRYSLALSSRVDQTARAGADAH
jgi:hypothetical protein